MEKRATTTRPQTAPCGGSRICIDENNRKCPRVMTPGCRIPANLLNVKENAQLVIVQRKVHSYPSYSECLKAQLDPVHPTPL
ncbi:hypothetical protein EVAR_72470_1 [Eumeta japonica]|uniref:Uncharacterized protein n=1 Tax=Eumeta variegata TaxID=151549 RepID=A0A4C1T8K2_EUMVA|nr:hypothetical protein EVAR_72470_1 [Eumeta japonica]